MSAVKEETVSTASFLTRNVSDILSDPIHGNTSTSATHLTTVGAQSAVFGLVLNQGLLAYARYGLLVVIGITEILGNALTIWAVLTTDRLRVKTYALTTSLAVTDLISGFVHVGYVVHEAISSTQCDMATYRGVVRPMERLIFYTSFMHIPAIAFDRFVAILHPLHYEDRMTPATIGRIIGVLWFIAAATSLPSYVGFATSVVRPQSCILTFWPMFETVVELSYYVISSSVVVFVYTKIWSIAMRHETQQQQQPQVSTVSKSVRFSAPSAQSDKRPTDILNGTGAELPPVEEPTSVPATGNPTKSQNTCWRRRRLVKTHRATRTIMIILGVFITMWFPYMLARFLELVVTGSKALAGAQILHTIGSILGSTSFSMNVFIYSLTNRDFSRAFKFILHLGTNEVDSLSGSV